MPEFFTVRTFRFHSNPLKLITDYGRLPCHAIESFYTEDEVRARLHQLFPNGLSCHGVQYVIDQHQSFRTKHGWILEHGPIIETQLELYRQINHPTKPSRFVSAFGVETLQEAIAYNERYRQSKGSIFKVEADDYLKVDMNWLRLAPTYLGFQVVADNYWSGKASGQPFWEILLQHPIRILEQVL